MYHYYMHWVTAFTLLAQMILDPGAHWDLLGQNYQLTADSAVDKNGIVYFTDARNSRILKINLDGRISTWKEASNGSHGVAWGPDGRLYAGQHDRKRIVAFTGDGQESVITEGLQTHHLTVTSRNHIYACEAPAHKVWLVDPAGRKRVVSDAIDWPRGICASPDGSRLIVNDARSKWVWSFGIQPDGSLTDGRRFCGLDTSPGKSDADAGGMAFDSDGFLYVATSLGVQVCDPRGRVTAIIDGPNREGLSGVFFAGPGLQSLYITDGNKIYRRAAKRRAP